MKTRFTTLDVCASVNELSQRLTGMRVINVYDIDSKTYLIKLQRQEEKAMLFIESGTRMHTTEFEWPKSMFPSGFAIKLRKHIKQKRLVSMRQLGIDRIVDLQFGSEDYAHHLIVELYDRGNIVLTDGNYNILNLLRKRIEKAKDESKPDLFGTDGAEDGATESGSQENKQNHDDNKENRSTKNQQGKKGKDAIANDDVKFSVGQVYPVEMAKQREPLISSERLKEIITEITTNRKDEQLKKALNPYFIYGHALLENCLNKSGFTSNVKVGDSISTDEGVSQVMDAIKMADSLIDQALSQICKGFIVQKIEKKPTASNSNENNEVITFQEFHPFLFCQHSSGSYKEYPSFDKAVDEFFSKFESQKLDVKALNQEKSALKKVENVKLDHEKRIKQLQSAQEDDMKKAELIELNLPLVDQAIQIVNSAIANQIDWAEIKTIVKEAQMQENPVALAIKDLQLDTNHITLMLRNPYDYSDDNDDDDDKSSAKKKKGKQSIKGIRININLALTAYANAQSYYKKKKQSAVKEQKTIDHSHQAIKSAKRKAQQTIKEVTTTASIQKARKTFWFEKFRWFISSENYLVIGGRDQQQNELIVKRHLTAGDIYVHADLHGASSIIVKNKPHKQPIPPKTLQEAGGMAICYSSAWDSKIVTSAWWVYHDQVSKTAPTGEYLTTGSFMIRGKKNFLPPTYLVMGFGILMRLDDSCIEHHLNERRVRGIEDDTESIAESTATTEADEELPLDDDDDDGDDNDNDEYEQKDKSDDANDQDSDSDEGPSLYPDTNIGVKVVGGKIQLNREISTSSTHDNDKDDEIFLGGENKVNLRENKEKASIVKEQKQSKTKRENKSKGGQQKEQSEQSTSKENTQKQQQQQQQQQQKRGKKAKQNKIKDKYGDQDEEERTLRMEILASAGEKKESKAQQRRLKKLNKGEKTARPVSGKKKLRQQDTTPLPWEQSAQPAASAEKVTSDPMVPSDDAVEVKKDSLGNLKEEIESTEDTKELAENDEDDDDDDISTQDFIKEGVTLLDTLTGCPTDEDALLFAVPVCAPYSAVNNYKFKVKMTPGTTKKGKATKTAISAFIQQKEANQREKDLIKSVKDGDLSKYIPGKVKVSAPNLSKLKKK